MPQLLLNRNEVMQGPAPACLDVLKNFDPHHVPRYLEGYYASPLRDALASRFSLPKEQILVGYGIENILRSIIDSLRPEKDTVLTNDFHYGYYDIYLGHKGIAIQTFALIKGDRVFSFNIEDCLQKLSSTKPTVLLITTPNNPTGNAMGIEDIRRIALAAPPQTLIVIDEAYVGLDESYPETALVPLLAECKNLMLLRTFSKKYALAGMRIGYALCGANAKAMIRYQDSYLGGSRLQEEVAVAALGAGDYYANLVRDIKEDRDYFTTTVNTLKHFKAYESKTNFVLVEVNPSGREMLQKRMETMDVLTGKFIDDTYLRVSIGFRAHTEATLEVLREAEYI